MNNSIFLQKTIKKIDLLSYCLALDDEVKKTLEEHSHIWEEYLAFTPDKMIVEQNNEKIEITDKEKIKQAQTTIYDDISNILTVCYYFYQGETLVFEKLINGCDFQSQRDRGEFYSKHEGSYLFIFSNTGEINEYICNGIQDGDITIIDSYTHFINIFTRLIYIGSIYYSITITNSQYQVRQIISPMNERDLLLVVKNSSQEESTYEHYRSILLGEDKNKRFKEQQMSDLRIRGFKTIDEILQEDNK